MKLLRSGAFFALAFGLAASAGAQNAVTPMTPDVVKSYGAVRADADFTLREVMIPMRDGTKLYTAIVFKKGAKNAPILISRSPYNAHGDVTRTASQKITEILPAMDAEFAEDGYIRVYQDIRGMHKSEGDWVLNRPIVGPLNNTGIDEATDAYDTIDWLVKNVPESNGKVGIIGSSYLGFTSLMALINPHPALKAAVPQSPMVDGWMGDDWFHNGAFRVNSFDYMVDMSVGKGDSDAKIPRGAGDDYSAYLEAGSAGDFARKWGIEAIPGVRKLMDNPAYTPFWSLQAVDKWLAARPLTVPTMLVVGQWDQEDSYGAPAVYRALEPKDTANDKLSLVIGPWRHSGVNHYGYELGDVTFTGDTAHEFRVKWLKPFFDHWLKDAPDPHTPPVLTYATGMNQWEVSQKWDDAKMTPLYLGAGGGLSFAPGAAGHDDYVSDPAHPVPFMPRPLSMADRKQWTTWLVHDQRFVEDRPDVLTYKSAPLDKPIHIKGAPRVDLYAATTGTDADWVVKLIDVAPDTTPEAASQGAKPANPGFELPLGIEIFRGRYVHGFATPGAWKPGKVENVRFELPHINHVLLPGHRLMVQVQSSLFPLYDRNPQTYVANIFNARASDYKAATQSIQRGGATASAVLLPIAQD
ncbi:hypothetical protein FHW96_002927 [Novosphingobium sp. SG751A]|uniref:CocE/NonD family hydrolase n=1 Tax=Novosphingobium sp. SG751A TaxID=2587000 RepID=UPI0015531D08|nr:hypothetical protein [Novosphingobium sp. SG751A]